MRVSIKLIFNMILGLPDDRHRGRVVWLIMIFGSS